MQIEDYKKERDRKIKIYHKKGEYNHTLKKMVYCTIERIAQKFAIETRLVRKILKGLDKVV